MTSKGVHQDQPSGPKSHQLVVALLYHAVVFSLGTLPCTLIGMALIPRPSDERPKPLGQALFDLSVLYPSLLIPGLLGVAAYTALHFHLRPRLRLPGLVTALVLAPVTAVPWLALPLRELVIEPGAGLGAAVGLVILGLLAKQPKGHRATVIR